MHASTFHRLSKPIALAPAVLVAYTIFAVAVTVTDFAVLPFTSDDFREWLVPRTGWVASMFYAFSIFFAFACIFQREGRTRIRLTITGFLILQVVLGVWELTGIRNENYGNPYLTINPWRSIWTIIIPSIWVIAFYFPSMNRFCKKVTELEEA
jgi:hypothetical protein